MALVLRSRLVPKNISRPVFHFAPEQSISSVLRELYGDNYQPADIDPDAYSWSDVPVHRIDLRRPLESFRSGSVGGFVHSHVLEHIPAPIERVVREMNDALAPGGFHIFQVPVHKGWYREDMDPDMDPAERTRLFHQDDHMRQFGDRDFEERVLEIFGNLERGDLSTEIDANALKNAAVPASALTRNTGHTVYLYIKPDS